MDALLSSVLMVGYKIVEAKNGDLLTLYHGVDGSRVLPVGEWITADEKPVVDGSGQVPYLSGFHVFSSRRIAEGYLAKFRKPRNLRVVEVETRGSRVKPTNPDVSLVSFLRVLTESNQ